MWVSIFQTQVLHPGPQVHTWQSPLWALQGRDISLSSLSPFLGGPLYPSAAIRSPKRCHFTLWEFVNCHGPQRQTRLFSSTCESYESPIMLEPVQAPNFLQRTGGMIYYSFIRHSTNWSCGCSCPWLFKVSEGFKGLCPLSFQTQLHGYCVFLDRSIPS